MGRKKTSFYLFLVGIFGLSYCLVSKIYQNKDSVEISQHMKDTNGSYFFPIPISKFTLANQPCISLEINGGIVSAMLDLGFRGQFSFSSQFLERVENKKHLHVKKMYGIKGTPYEEKLYEGPEIQVGPMSFPHPILHECAEAFDMDSVIRKGVNEVSTPEPGVVGWELFGNTNLFLDLGNSQIAFCDSLNTLKERGYATEEFIKTPLLLERGLVELCAETPKGLLRCMLDTGATCNVFDAEVKEGRSIEQWIDEPDNLLLYESFKIGDKNFGPLSFHQVPIKLPIRIEAILGMEFFEDHIVFLDFAEGYAYLLKVPKTANEL